MAGRESEGISLFSLFQVAFQACLFSFMISIDGI